MVIKMCEICKAIEISRKLNKIFVFVGAFCLGFSFAIAIMTLEKTKEKPKEYATP